MYDIIDAHVHLGFGGRTNMQASVESLLRAMDDASISKSIVLAGNINGCSTERLLEEVKLHRDRLIPIGSTSLSQDWTQRDNETKILSGLLKSGDIQGLKFYPGYESFYPSDSRLRPYLNLLIESRRPAIFHCGDLYNVVSAGSKLKYCHPLEIDDLAADMPNLKIIMAHMGNPFVTEAAAVYLSKPNVYVDCSGYVYGKFDERDRSNFLRMMNKFLEITQDSSRILFGSDWPISDPTSYVEAVCVTAYEGLYESKDVLRNNAAKLWGI